MLGVLLGMAAVTMLLRGASLTTTSTCQTMMRASNKTSTTTADPYALARSESFGFFDTILESDWKLHQERFRSEPIFKNASSSTTDPRERPEVALWMLENVDPMFACPHIRRIGGRGDGPKWICDPHRLRNVRDCLVYSIGSAGKYQFEDGLIASIGGTNCEIHVFDPSPKFAREGDAETNNM